MNKHHAAAFQKALDALEELPDTEGEITVVFNGVETFKCRFYSNTRPIKPAPSRRWEIAVAIASVLFVSGIISHFVLT